MRNLVVLLHKYFVNEAYHVQIRSVLVILGNFMSNGNSREDTTKMTGTEFPGGDVIPDSQSRFARRKHTEWQGGQQSFKLPLCGKYPYVDYRKKNLIPCKNTPEQLFMKQWQKFVCFTDIRKLQNPSFFFLSI